MLTESLVTTDLPFPNTCIGCLLSGLAISLTSGSLTYVTDLRDCDILLTDPSTIILLQVRLPSGPRDFTPLV